MHIVRVTNLSKLQDVLGRAGFSMASEMSMQSMRRINFTNTQVASSETARDINRGVVLNLIRRRQPISRADLARVSGLQRSTVSLITEQLIREKWVVYGPVGRSRKKRSLPLRIRRRQPCSWRRAFGS